MVKGPPLRNAFGFGLLIKSPLFLSEILLARPFRQAVCRFSHSRVNVGNLIASRREASLIEAGTCAMNEPKKLIGEMSMKRLIILASFCLGLATFGVVQGQDETKVEAQQESQDLAERLKATPDDEDLFNQYMIQQLGSLRQILQSDPDKAEKIVAEMKSLIESLEPETDPGKTNVQRAKMVLNSYGQQIELARVTLEQLVARLEEDPNDSKSLTMYLSKVMSEIAPMTSDDPDLAEERLAAAREFVAGLKEKMGEDGPVALLERMEGSFESLASRIATGKRLASLVGMKAAPMEIETWVNGDPLTESDLKGKVVILDFWAVWCGPCIATFPHLREWHEKYSDKGLEIVGLTRYYNYQWDEDEDRAMRAGEDEEVTPEQEQEMLVKFAEQHELKHRFAIQDGSELSEYYAVSGIPHVVVIDREGTIRMIKIGSGEANANAISELLEQLFSEGA